MLVTGDFNCSPESACSAFLAFGSVMPGVIEYGREVAAEVTQVAAHSHSLESVQYRAEGVDFSFTATALGARSWCGLLDHVWYSPTSLRYLRLVETFTSMLLCNACWFCQDQLRTTIKDPSHFHVKQMCRTSPALHRCERSTHSLTPVTQDMTVDAACFFGGELLACWLAGCRKYERRF